MRDSTISTPRIDVNFVDSNGKLTQSAYALLYGLLERVGGVTAPVIDVLEIIAMQEFGGNTGAEESRAAIIELRSDLEQFASHGRIAAAEENIAALSEIDVFALLAQVAALREQVAALAGRINEFEQGPSL